MNIQEEKIAFEKRIRRHQGKILGLIRRYIRDQSASEDVFQQTLIRAWINRAQFEGKSAYGTWLCQIAINTSLNYIVAQKRKIKIIRHAGNPFHENLISDHYMFLSPDIYLADVEHLELLRTEVLKLGPETQTTFVLNVIYGLKYHEIAEVLKVPTGTVRTRIRRARLILKNKFKDII